MNWQNILKNTKKDILEGLHILQQNITPDILEKHTMERGIHMFNIKKKNDSFYFGRVSLRINEPEPAGFGSLKNIKKPKEKIVSIIKELKESNLKNYSDENGKLRALFVVITPNIDEQYLEIDMKRK